MHVGSIIALPGAPETFVLEIKANQIIYIGRKTKSNLSGAEQCITLPYPEVSAKHAEIRCTENVWTIIDNGSTNGTTINNVPINPGKEYVLKDQDTVGIANYNLFISLPNQDTNNLATTPQQELAAEQDKTHFQVNLINATILVADIKSFSTLMEEFAHDPSTVMQATGNVFSYLSKEIEKSEGRLEKIAGDAIMAYWTSKEKNIGAQLSCHKACLTALHLKQIMITIAKDKKIWPFEKHPLAFDIALATGTVASSR
jgi:pSer/pThr/pTyr-binding forkhead associated (FHA) protein